MKTKSHGYLVQQHNLIKKLKELAPEKSGQIDSIIDLDLNPKALAKELTALMDGKCRVQWYLNSSFGTVWKSLIPSSAPESGK